MKKSNRGTKSRTSHRRSSSKKRQGTRGAEAIAPATVVGTTQEAGPKLVVTHRATLAEAIAEPVVDMTKGKPISVRKLARRIA